MAAIRLLIESGDGGIDLAPDLAGVALDRIAPDSGDHDRRIGIQRRRTVGLGTFRCLRDTRPVQRQLTDVDVPDSRSTLTQMRYQLRSRAACRSTREAARRPLGRPTLRHPPGRRERNTLPDSELKRTARPDRDSSTCGPKPVSVDPRRRERCRARPWHRTPD